MCFEHICPRLLFPDPLPSLPTRFCVLSFATHQIQSALPIYSCLGGLPLEGSWLNRDNTLKTGSFSLSSYQLPIAPLLAVDFTPTFPLHGESGLVWAFMRVFVKTVLLFSLGGPQNHGDHASASQETETAGLCPCLAQVQYIVKITAATSEYWAFRCVTWSS